MHQELKDLINQCKDKKHSRSYLIKVLHKAQNLEGYLKKETMDEIAHLMQIPSAHIWGVATFYHYFKLNVPGKYIISVCMGTACYVKGAEAVLKAIQDELKIKIGETTSDRLFSLEETRCLGACGLAPVIMINEKIYGKLDAHEVVKLLRKFKDENTN